MHLRVMHFNKVGSPVVLGGLTEAVLGRTRIATLKMTAEQALALSPTKRERLVVDTLVKERDKKRPRFAAMALIACPGSAVKRSKRSTYMLTVAGWIYDHLLHSTCECHTLADAKYLIGSLRATMSPDARGLDWAKEFIAKP